MNNIEAKRDRLDENKIARKQRAKAGR